MKYLYINVDTNDGDYISSLNQITDEELIKILPVIEAIKNFKPYTTKQTKYSHHETTWTHDNNYPSGDVCREDLGEKSAFELYGHYPGFYDFDYYVPGCEYGMHTIESILVLDVLNEEKLL